MSATLVDAQSLTLANPHWNITLTDYGYSDFLLDNTPGFQGREYLSGEWGAAVGYQVSGKPLVMPQWLEPHFAYPDWTTPSSFHVASPITLVGLNTDGLPVARSVISNADVQITMDYEMIDTVVGSPIGTIPASAGSTGTVITSDRYMLKQTYTVKNISSATITNLQVFQFLHGLQSQRGVYDNRLYPGHYSGYRYDTTLVGVDASAVGTGSSASGLEDYICFQSSIAPSAYEVGYYGIEGNGLDNHVVGKPSEGVHLSIENNWQSAPYSARQGTDAFAPVQRWISGAERWNMGSLASGQSASLDVLLSLCTGTKVDPGIGSTGGCNGGSSVPGGLDYEFEDVTGPGSCFAEYAQADTDEIAILVANGEFDPLTFPTPGGPAQIWNVSFSGTFAGAVTLSFAYDPMLLPPDFDVNALCMYQFDGTNWQQRVGTLDALRHTITVTVTALSAFALGADGGSAFTVNASAAPTGAGTLTGTGTCADGSSVTLTAVANGGYAFSNWTENASVVSTSPSYTFTVHSNRTLVANFTIVGTAKTVSTSSQPANGGSTSGDGPYAQGSSATVVATANGGYKFSKWLASGAVVSTSSNYTFTVTNNIILTAKFKPVYRIVVSADTPAYGDVEADLAYELGELAKIKAIPFSGYAFVNWTEHDLPVSDDPLYQFTVSGNRELVGHFASGNRIDATVSPPHAGTTIGGGVHPAGANVDLEAQANPGYIFLNWTESNAVVGTSTAYSLTSDTHHTLVANFLMQPDLRHMTSTSGIPMFAWPADAPGWTLQESPDMNPGSWFDSPRPIDVVNAQKRFTISPLSGKTFFRLSHP